VHNHDRHVLQPLLLTWAFYSYKTYMQTSLITITDNDLIDAAVGFSLLGLYALPRY